MDLFFTKFASVQIKSGIVDLKSGVDLGGWQGRIYEFLEGEGGDLVAYIRWDSQTIRRIPDGFRSYCMANQLSWVDMLLGTESLTLAAARDTMDEADWERSRALSRYVWTQLGETGKKICSIFDTFTDNRKSVLQAWENYLREHLTFPFSATMKKKKYFSTRGSRKVIVHSLNGSEETYGVTVLAEINHQEVVIPITDIFTPRGADNYDVLENYRFWFANQ